MTEDEPDLTSSIIGPYHSAYADQHIASTCQDHEHLDSLRDRFLEASKKPGGVDSLVSELIANDTDERASNAIVEVIALIADARHPRLCAMALGWAAGIQSYQDKPAVELARRNGVTKQAFCQLAAKLIKQLGLRRTRTMRSEAARKSMSNRYRERMRSKRK